MFRRTLTTVVLLGALVAGPAGAALAHECFIANRSAKGNAGANHSDNWETLFIADIIAGAPVEEFGLQPLTPEQQATAIALAAEAGIPSSVTIRVDKTIGYVAAKDALAPGLARQVSDGKGVDYFFETYVPVLMRILEEVGTPIGQ